MMKMEILIHELLHMFEEQVLMLSGFYLKKFIVKVLVKTRGTHFNPLLLLDPLLIQVLNIVVGMAVYRRKAGIRPNPPHLDQGWTIHIGRWTYTGIPV